MPTTPLAEPTTDYSLMMLEDFEFEVPCESQSRTCREMELHTGSSSCHVVIRCHGVLIG